MGDLKLDLQQTSSQAEAKPQNAQAEELLEWDTPRMEEVSEQVMAQPYIRFT